MKKNKNVTLIGMPGAGKSTIGVILAKILSFGFLDTDILIQRNRKKSLQQILDEGDHLHLRKIEEEEILKIDVVHHVIATGGSAVYSEKAMAHLRSMSLIVFLQVGFDELGRRIHNFDSRGIAKAKDQSFQDLFNERQVLYEKHADLLFDCKGLDQERIAGKIAARFRGDT